MKTVDLEKTCDEVCWDFLKDTLVNVRLPLGLVRALNCVSSSFMQVLWSETVTDVFYSTRVV